MATLIPVAILIDGKFYDASVYKSDPVPMALESGTVYEAEQAGDSVGLFTISGALHSKTAGSPHPWLGAGSYLPHGTEAPKATRKAEDVPVGLDTSANSMPYLTSWAEDSSLEVLELAAALTGRLADRIEGVLLADPAGLQPRDQEVIDASEAVAV